LLANLARQFSLAPQMEADLPDLRLAA
jgi:hypothetical protein